MILEISKFQQSPDVPIPKAAFLTLEHLPARVRDIAALRGLGYSYRQIGQSIGVTPQAVSVMLVRHRRALKSLHGSMELYPLSSRALNTLKRHGIRSRREARERNVVERLTGERNCGCKTIQEIRCWMSEEPLSAEEKGE